METTSTRCTAALGLSRSDRLLLGEMFDQETGVESGIRPWHHRFRKMHASFQRPVGARPSRRRRRRRTWTPESAFNAMPPAVLGSGGREGERGNGRETDLNFERLLCNLGAVGSHGARYEGCRCCRRLAKVEVLSPSMSWLIERPTAHPLPTPTQKNQRALDRGTGCTTGGPMSHQDKVRTVWLPGLAICAPPSGTAPHHHGLRSIPSVAASSLYQRLPPALTLDPRLSLQVPSRPLRSIESVLPPSRHQRHEDT